MPMNLRLNEATMRKGGRNLMMEIEIIWCDSPDSPIRFPTFISVSTISRMNSGEECKPRMREFRIRRRKKEKKKRDKTENTGRTSHLTATPESLKINSKNPRRKNDEYPKKAIIDSKESLV